MQISELWQQFYLHLRARRRTAATLRYYECTERVFARFLEAQGLVLMAEDVRVSHLRLFLRWLEDQGLSIGGVHAHARAVRALFNWSAHEEILEKSPAQRLELPTLVRERMPTVTAAVVKSLLGACRDSDQPLRDAALIVTLFDTGLRVQELVDLRMTDLLFPQGLIRVLGKGNKERFVPIGAKATLAVNAYLRKERRPAVAGQEQVLLNRGGQPLTKSGVQIRLSKLAVRVKIARQDCAPHAFRRGFAVEFLRNGGDVFTLQQILGHSSLDMTRRYVTYLDGDLKAAHLRFSPGDRL